jgi:hypothetical protein
MEVYVDVGLGLNKVGHSWQTAIDRGRRFDFECFLYYVSFKPQHVYI